MKVSDISVEYIDHMGSDLTVVNAARVSFDKESDWIYNKGLIWQRILKFLLHQKPSTEKALSREDAKLINYLAKHNHWSPFAHTSIQLRVKAPIFVARQLVKHQTGGVWNEVSRRYVDFEPEFYMPAVWRGRPEGSLKQGSSGEVTLLKLSDDEEYPINDEVEFFIESANWMYDKLIKSGVAPEMARMILPLNSMTEWYWTGSLYFWARVCNLRLDSHAQPETSIVAQQISNIVKDLFPVSWKALITFNKD